MSILSSCLVLLSFDMETPIQIASGDETLSGMLYLPAGTPRCGLVMCHPLFEERKSAQRVMVDAARAFAAAGCAVLRFDYRGCGDSTGDFTAFSCPEWREDIERAVRCLTERLSENRLVTGGSPGGSPSRATPTCSIPMGGRGARRAEEGVPIGLLGLRLGGSLALDVASSLPAVNFAILWEPIVNGRRFFDQELRRKLVREMVTFGQSRVTRASLMKDLEDGKPIDLDGYGVTARLFEDLGAVDLTRIGGSPEYGESRPTEDPSVFCSNACPRMRGRRFLPLRLLLVQIGPTNAAALTGLRDTLAGQGAAVDLVSAPEDPFWNLVGLVQCPALIEKTVRWLLDTQGGIE
jgi:pimeloyl-ACP methyl ester carboxylesterase